MRSSVVSRRAILFALFVFSVPCARAADPPKPGKINSYQFSDWYFHHSAGWKALSLNKLTKAEYCFNKAIEVAVAELETDPRLAARSYGDLAWVLHREGRNTEALPLAKWSLSVREKWFGPNSMQVAQSMYTVAAIDLKLNEVDEAEDLFSRILTSCRTHLGANAFETADSMEDLAAVYMIKRTYSKARLLYQNSLDSRTVGTSDNPSQIFALDGLAAISLAEGKESDAENYLSRVVSLIKKTSRVERAFDSQFVTKIYERQAELYRKTNRPELAEAAEKAAKAEAESQATPNRADIPHYQSQVPGSAVPSQGPRMRN